MAKHYHDAIEQITKGIGGIENVSNLMHCVTRLRYTLNDINKADIHALKNVEGVVDVIVKNDQCQIVIGQKVTEYYDEIISEYPELDSARGKKPELENTEKKTVLATLFDTISGIFVPILGALALTAATEGTVLDIFGFIPMEPIQYTNSVLPPIIIVYVLSKLIWALVKI